MDAVGPETYTYSELVTMIKTTIASRTLLVHCPPTVVRLASRVLGAILKDVVLTEDEIKGLMADLLVSNGRATARTSLRGWIKAHTEMIGNRYASELGRHYILG